MMNKVINYNVCMMKFCDLLTDGETKYKGVKHSYLLRRCSDHQHSMKARNDYQHYSTVSEMNMYTFQCKSGQRQIRLQQLQKDMKMVHILQGNYLCGMN